MMELFKGLLMEEEGQGMTEYGLILGMLVVAVVGAFVLLTGQFETIFGDIVSKITGAISGGGTDAGTQ